MELFLKSIVTKISYGQVVMPLDTHLVVIVDVNGLARITQPDSGETLGEVASGKYELACQVCSSHFRLAQTQ